MSKKTINTNYKRTTDQQYRLLTRELAKGTSQGKHFWLNLTESLNNLGPPYRNMSQWKKVWTDFRRFHSRRNFQSQPKFQKHLKQEPNVESAVDYEEYDNSQTMYQANMTRQKSPDDDEIMNFEQNSLSMHSTFSNDCSDQYSYADRKYDPYEHPSSSSLQGQSAAETLIPDDDEDEQPTFACNSYAYAETVHDPPPPPRRKVLVARTATSAAPVATKNLPSTSSSSKLMDQTLYTLQNQMENQTKLLEHLSQISSTMAGLMERQVTAIEKQTEAIRRQASATEHHTLVMNSFVDMIREKMPKTSLVKTPAPDVPNGNL